MGSRENLPKHTDYYLNLEQVECMFGEDWSNPPGELLEMLRKLIADTTTKFQKLRSEWDIRPDEERRKQIHGMRGTIVNFGLSKVCDILEEVEKNPEDLSPDEIKASFSEAFSAFNVSVDLMKAIFPQL